MFRLETQTGLGWSFFSMPTKPSGSLQLMTSCSLEFGLSYSVCLSNNDENPTISGIFFY